MARKLTLDAGLIHEASPALTKLKAWQQDNRIELFEADRAENPSPKPAPYTWPGATPSARPAGRRTAPKKNAASASLFSQMSSVLFPHRDSHKLSMGEINNVAHLIRHQTRGHDVFVTVNRRDFIDDGKRDRLRTYFKIVVMTPEEVVEMLRVAEGWK